MTQYLCSLEVMNLVELLLKHCCELSFIIFVPSMRGRAILAVVYEVVHGRLLWMIIYAP